MKNRFRSPILSRFETRGFASLPDAVRPVPVVPAGPSSGAVHHNSLPAQTAKIANGVGNVGFKKIIIIVC